MKRTLLGVLFIQGNPTIWGLGIAPPRPPPPPQKKKLEEGWPESIDLPCVTPCS